MEVIKHSHQSRIIPGLVIEFYTENEYASVYSFRIKGDEVLTKKLLLATRHHKIAPKNFNLRIESLISIIQKGEFKVIARGTNASKYYEKFEKKYREKPKFNIFDRSLSGKPLYEAQLTNYSSDNNIGKSRSKKDAMVEALKLFFRHEIDALVF